MQASPYAQIKSAFRASHPIASLSLPKAGMGLASLDALYRQVALPLGMEMIMFDRERGLRCASFPTSGYEYDAQRGIVFNSCVRLGVADENCFSSLMGSKVYADTNLSADVVDFLKAGELRAFSTSKTDRQGVTWVELPGCGGWVIEKYELPRLGDPMVQVWSFMREYISQVTNGRVLFVLSELTGYLDGQIRDSDFGQLVRQGLLNISEDFQSSHKRVVLIGEQLTFDRTFAGIVEQVSLTLPNAQEFSTALSATLNDLSGKFEIARQQKLADGQDEEANALRLAVNLSPEEKEEICHKAAGLSLEEFSYALRLEATSRYCIDASSIAVIERKQQESLRANKLDVIDLSRESIPAGLENFKAWCLDRKELFWLSATSPVEDEDEMDIPAPKGALLLGLPGTGKSAMSKGLALLWGLPLVRLNLAAMKDSFVGQTTKNIRSALAAVEAGGTPKVLWVDEIDKAAAGAAADYQGDSGTSKELIGEFLTWMQEKKSPTFVIFTANNISKLESAHPELFRAGRLDATFFVDLPDAIERQAILEFYLSRQRCNLTDTEMKSLLSRTEGLVGSELEQLVIAGMIISAKAGRRKKGEMQLADLMAAREQIKPVADRMRSQVAELQAWARDNAIPASAPNPVVESTSTRKSRQPTVSDSGSLLL